ncbi:MAG: ion transporter [Deltaproteobacteria bacterium]|nr:ion transporter [Deltaproteobacteria bacterium]
MRASVRARLGGWVESQRVQRVIILLIALNAITLGLETSPSLMASAGSILSFLDRAVLAVFVAEIALRLVAHGARFFRDAWSIFDLLVVSIALFPATGALSVLRALRVLRVLRLVSAVPRMRRVVQALLAAIPGMGAIIALMGLVFYVSSVIATKLFGAAFPEWFGTIGRSLYSLFQIMTLESWSMGIVRPVLEVKPYAWIFFIPFILVTTFTMLNLFIAVIVNAMQSSHADEIEHVEKVGRQGQEERELLLEEVRLLRRRVEALHDRLPAGEQPGSN